MGPALLIISLCHQGPRSLNMLALLHLVIHRGMLYNNVKTNTVPEGLITPGKEIRKQLVSRRDVCLLLCLARNKKEIGLGKNRLVGKEG